MKGGICHLEYHHRSFIWAEHVHWELVLSNYVLLSVTMCAMWPDFLRESLRDQHHRKQRAKGQEGGGMPKPPGT